MYGNNARSCPAERSPLTARDGYMHAERWGLRSGKALEEHHRILHLLMANLEEERAAAPVALHSQHQQARLGGLESFRTVRHLCKAVAGAARRRHERSRELHRP
eukprot:CAMPEP_0180124820 /NCGR_PEP_ID=MMETSP0986-20121125/4855_1 /TAXON_ID=697907 /ORGANISM="non described non described, Strain CCMP2293" /LENGTH=103 /DNA_ID=CAMNT_0022064185 /DNA_START=668 /DNA_END=979 /DNA_ORIENTATION=-